MSYQFILAEEVAAWVRDQRIAKTSFEEKFGHLKPAGLNVVNIALEAIKATFFLEDYSDKDMVEDQGWHEVTKTFLYSKEPMEELERVAEEAVRKKYP